MYLFDDMFYVCVTLYVHFAHRSVGFLKRFKHHILEDRQFTIRFVYDCKCLYYHRLCVVL